MFNGKRRLLIVAGMLAAAVGTTVAITPNAGAEIIGSLGSRIAIHRVDSTTFEGFTYGSEWMEGPTGCRSRAYIGAWGGGDLSEFEPGYSGVDSNNVAVHNVLVKVFDEKAKRGCSFSAAVLTSITSDTYGEFDERNREQHASYDGVNGDPAIEMTVPRSGNIKRSVYLPEADVLDFQVMVEICGGGVKPRAWDTGRKAYIGQFNQNSCEFHFLEMKPSSD